MNYKIKNSKLRCKINSVCLFLSLLFFLPNSNAQQVTPWDYNESCNSLITTGIAAMTCGVTTYVTPGSQYTFGFVDMNGALPATGRIDVSAFQDMYHHPDYDVTQIGNVYGLTMDDCGYTYICASSNYGADFFGQQAVIRYGDIGGGAEDLNAAGTVYRIDKETGAPSVWAVLPQQASSFTHVSCEGFNYVDRNTGPGLGNICYFKESKNFYVSNFEDSRIYRLDENGQILDSFDPILYNAGTPGVEDLNDLTYGLAISPDGTQLFFGTGGQTFGSFASIYSIDLNTNGSFVGSIDNTYLPAGATWDNYIGTVLPHYNVDPGYSFQDTYFISDLEFAPNNKLLVGVRIGCNSSVATSYNHYGKTIVLSEVGGFYGLLDGEIVTSGPYSLAGNDAYGGVGVFDNPNGGIEYIISSGDMISEVGPHGICTVPEGVFGSYNNPASPSGIISYGPPDMNDPKGIGGDVQMFIECFCQTIDCSTPTDTLVANFNIASLGTCINDSLQFLNATALADSLAWNFGDGSPISNETNPIHTYDSPGIYVVTLYAFSDDECFAPDSLSQTIEVEEQPQITASFEFTPAQTCDSLLVSFNNTSILANTFIWDFGDGSPQVTDENPNHNFDGAGNYIVTLIASDSTSCAISDTAEALITVSACIVCPDSVESNIPTDSCSGIAIDLSASVFLDGIVNDTIATLAWYYNGDPISNSITINNTECFPIEIEIVVEATCIEDPSIVLYDTSFVLIQPENPGLFVETNSDECTVTAQIVAGCEEYIVLDNTIITFNPGESGTANIIAAYNTGVDCDEPDTLMVDYYCPQCIIDAADIEVLECDGDNFEISLSLTGQDFSDSFIVTDQDGNELGTFNYSDMPVTIGPFFGDEVSVYSINITDSEDPNCTFETSFGPVDCLPCNISEVILTASNCEQTDFTVALDLVVINPNNTFTVLDEDGNSMGSFAYTELPLTFGPLLGDNISTYTFTVFDDDENECTAEASVGPIACYVCDLANFSISGECNGTDLATFDVFASFEGNNIYTISDQDGNVYASGIEAGNDIFVGAFPNNAEVTFIVSDDWVDDCTLTDNVDCILCDPSLCNSQEGTIMASSTKLCPDEAVIIDADDFLLMPKQSVFYIFHNQETVTVNDLPDLINDVYTTGSFLNNNGDAIPCGTVAYATAIGAMENHDMPGFPSYADICLTVSNTIPIYFMCPVEIEVEEICDNSTGEFSFNFTISGGYPTFFPSTGYTITGDYSGYVNENEVQTVGPLEDSESYTITAVDDEGCSATVTNQYICEKLPIELLSFTGEVQADGNYLKWASASEINNDYYDLEASTDGANFTLINSTTGAGTSSIINNYDYLDRAAQAGTTYYRLSQTDFDGTNATLGIVTLTRGESLNIQLLDLYPMPFDEQLSISFSSNIEDEILISIYNTAGQLQTNQLFNANFGFNNFEINTNDLSAGVYLIQMQFNDEIVVKKVMKH